MSKEDEKKNASGQELKRELERIRKTYGDVNIVSLKQEDVAVDLAELVSFEQQLKDYEKSMPLLTNEAEDQWLKVARLKKKAPQIEVDLTKLATYEKQQQDMIAGAALDRLQKMAVIVDGSPKTAKEYKQEAEWLPADKDMDMPEIEELLKGARKEAVEEDGKWQRQLNKDRGPIVQEALKVVEGKTPEEVHGEMMKEYEAGKEYGNFTHESLIDEGPTMWDDIEALKKRRAMIVAGNDANSPINNGRIQYLTSRIDELTSILSEAVPVEPSLAEQKLLPKTMIRRAGIVRKWDGQKLATIETGEPVLLIQAPEYKVGSKEWQEKTSRSYPSKTESSKTTLTTPPEPTMSDTDYSAMAKIINQSTDVMPGDLASILHLNTLLIDAIVDGGIMDGKQKLEFVSALKSELIKKGLKTMFKTELVK